MPRQTGGDRRSQLARGSNEVQRREATPGGRANALLASRLATRHGRDFRMTRDRLFRIPRLNVVEGPDFGLEFKFPGGIEYWEPNRRVHIDAELLAVSGYAVYEASIETWEPSGKPVTESDRARILRNVRAAFEFRGIDFGLVRRPDRLGPLG
jgi:hypothetical protein